MHLIYIDDSRDEALCVFSALFIPAQEWKGDFAAVREFRGRLKRSDGIHVYKEFHAWKFVSGRGDLGAVVTKWRRCGIFRETLKLVSELPGAKLMNAVFPVNREEHAFERMLNRINRNMHACDSQALLICDEGKEADYTRLARKMAVFNHIPSRYGQWHGTGSTKNIPIDRIIEDPFFKQSDKSYFVQLVDFCAYALLRRERPLPSKEKYGISSAFSILAPILIREANGRDREGIIRP